MKIGIDARFLTLPQPGGFKTYTENLVAALARIDHTNQYVIYVDRPPDTSIQIPRQPNVTLRIVSGELPLIGMPWREQIGLSARARRDHLDLLHAPCLTAPITVTCPLVITIHDMIWLFIEQFARDGRRPGKRRLLHWYNRFIPLLTAHRAAAILTVSHAAKQSILEHLNVPADQVFVTHPAPSPIYRPMHSSYARDEIWRHFHLEAGYILALGSADPRKNLSAMLQAYVHLPEQLQRKHHLVIVWTHPLLKQDILQQAEQFGIAHRVRSLEQVSNQMLAMLYNAAILFAFPSRYEGFGLPPLEAMTCGTPVIAAANSSIPEIVGDAALLTPTENITALTDALTRVLTDATLRQTLIQKGLQRAGSFSWQRCAHQTLAVYRRVYQIGQADRDNHV